MRRSGLGKGLGALIPTDGTSHVGAALQELPVGAIEPNPHQPRLDVRRGHAHRADGLDPRGRRPAARARAPAAGARAVPAHRRRATVGGRRIAPASTRSPPSCVARTISRSAEQALIENLHRQDLNPLDEAAGYRQLIDDFGLTHEEVAHRVGKSRATITNTLRLLQLPPKLQHLVHDGRLSAGHARALLGTNDRAFQEGLARQAAAGGLVGAGGRGSGPRPDRPSGRRW